MKPRFGDEDEAYQFCVADGYVREVFTVNKDRAEALHKNSTLFLSKDLADWARREIEAFRGA